MARAFISHSSLDKPFVLRLAEDLRKNWIDVWVDAWELRIGDNLATAIESSLADASHVILVLSDKSSRSAWVKRELDFAANRESERLGMMIVTARLPGVDVPAELRDTPVADFSGDYDAGLEALLSVFAAARVGRGAALPGRRYSSAVRGHGGALSVPSHLSSLVVGGRQWAFTAVTETLGDAKLRPEFTRAIHELLLATLEKFKVSGPESLSHYLQIANAAALLFKSERGLGTDFPLGAKMALLVQYEDTVYVSTLGACSALARYAEGDGYALMRIESAARVPFLAADGPEPGIAISAPLGFLTPSEEPWADWKRVQIAAPGDFVALATFRFCRDEGLPAIGSALAQQNDPQRIAIMLAETHVPRTADSLCGVLIREGW
jgi:hypothetical protein